METPNSESRHRLTPQEQRASLQDRMKIALATNNMKEYHRLNGHLQWLEEKLRSKKNGIEEKRDRNNGDNGAGRL